MFSNILKAIIIGGGLAFIIWFLFAMDANEYYSYRKPISTEDSNRRAAHYHERRDGLMVEDSLTEDTDILNHSRIPCPGDSAK